MKIAILLGRGIEGCGVTRYALESKEWHQAQGHEVTIYATKDKNWGRANAQQGDIVTFKNDEIKNIREKLNACDIVYYQSLPSTDGHSVEYQELFLKHLVKEVTNPIKISFQNDHKKTSLLRNANLFEFTQYMDAAFTHSYTSTFVSLLKEHSIDLPILKMGVGFNFDELSSFIKDTNDQDFKITYFGRYATFKQPHRMYEMHPYTKEVGMYSEMLGIEASLASLKLFWEDPLVRTKPRTMMHHVKKQGIPEIKTPDYVYVYGPYIRTQGLETLSKSMFGADFYRLDARTYGDNFEYAMTEIIAVGCIPVFDIHWASNCHHRDGRLFKDIKDFAIYYDEKNPQLAIDEMVYLYNNPIEREKRRKSCLEIAKSHCSTDVVFQDQWNQLQKVTKRTNAGTIKFTNQSLF